MVDNRFRRFLYDPRRLFGPYVKPGMTVMDVGCGMGLNPPRRGRRPAYPFGG